MKIFSALPGSARAAFITGAVAVLIAAGLGLTAETLNPPAITVSPRDHGGPGFVAVGLVVVVILVGLAPALVGVLLSRESAGPRRTGAVLAAVSGLIGLLVAVRGPVPFNISGPAADAAVVGVRIAIALAAAALCAVAYLGLRDAADADLGHRSRI